MAESVEVGGRDARRDGLRRATSMVGDRWTLLVVDELLAGPARFSDLEQRVEGISPTVLTARLKELEAGGVVVARPYQDRPVRYDYRLTDRGRGLASTLDVLAAWGHDDADPPVHARCGTALGAVLWCATCEEPADGETDALVHL